MSVERLLISIELEGLKSPVGELVLHEKNYLFKFDSDFLSKGLEISPFKMKLSNEVLKEDSQPFEGIFGVFHDSLPDGWGRFGAWRQTG